MNKRLLLNLSIEFGPIIVFLITSELLSFINATTLFVVLTFIALIVGFIDRREIALFPVIVSLSIIGFGVLTIILDNPFFIIFKDTVYNTAFALVLFGGLAFGHGLLKPLFKEIFAITEKGWRTLSYRWAVLFVILAVSNEIARLTLTPDEWVYFKALATISTSIFAIYQIRLSKKERLANATPWGLKISHERPQVN